MWLQSSSDALTPGSGWPTVWTLGHSTRSKDEFTQIVAAYKIENLADVRSFPSSRRYPHFNKESLAEWLAEVGVKYKHLPTLGGRRRLQPDSRSSNWKNPSFRAYADYMESEEFTRGIAQLLTLAQIGRTSLMCAEALWWRCHRSLIADYLKARGASVIHIVDARKTESHSFTSAARIVEGKLSYGPITDAQSGLFNP